MVDAHAAVYFVPRLGYLRVFYSCQFAIGVVLADVDDTLFAHCLDTRRYGHGYKAEHGRPETLLSRLLHGSSTDPGI